MVAEDIRTKVLLVDDHPLTHAGVQWCFRDTSDLILVGNCITLAEGVAAIEACDPNIVIVDLRLPDGDGLDLVRRLANRIPPVPALVFSASEESVFGERVLRAGGKGFVEKTVAIEKLVDAVRTVLSGRIYLSELMQQRVASIVSGGSAEQDPMKSLSDRELQVFELIGQGKSTREIASHLRRSVKTIETYRDRLRKKLRLDSGSALTHRAIERASRPTAAD